LRVKKFSVLFLSAKFSNKTEIRLDREVWQTFQL